MAKAGAVAIELRKLADSLDKEPATEIGEPHISLWAETKEEFMTFSRALPRPVKKQTDIVGETTYILLTHYDGPLAASVRVPQSFVCELVEPAKPAVYKCTPILSAEEESELEGKVNHD